MKIGIVGYGVVGSAVASKVKADDLSVWDKYKPTVEWNKEFMLKSDIIFVCVPTPTIDGSQKLDCLHAALESLTNFSGVVAIKSTTLPGTMNNLAQSYRGLRLVHNPEFMCARSSIADYADQKAILLSGHPADTKILDNYFHALFDERFLAITHDDRYETTEWAKYIHNCMLAVKLSFLNEIRDLIGDPLIYHRAANMAYWFGNVGDHHKVPGPDGQRGWGGMCLPKDVVALLTFALKQSGPEPKTLMGAAGTNCIHRASEMASVTHGT